MKKIIPLVLVTLLMLVSLQSTTANTGQQNVKNNAAWIDFYKHIFNNANYTEKAQEANLQGNSLVLFTIAQGGQLKNIKVEAELGLGLDLSIVNGILSYPNFKNLKVGKYALITLFLIDQSKAEIRNKDISIPQGYTALEKIEVTALNIDCGRGPNSPQIVSTPKIHTFSSDIIADLDRKVLNSFKNNTREPKNVRRYTLLRRPSRITDYRDIGKNGGAGIRTKQEESADTTQKKNTTIQLRGTSSSQINSPLYIVDDQLVDNINTINPNKIQNITILRDASAFALYGDSAKNGVVIITTKKETKQVSKP